MVYWIVAHTAFILSHQFSESDAAFSSRKKNRLPLLDFICCNNKILWIIHLMHLNRKYWIVSLNASQSHWSDFITSIWYKYLCNLIILILSCVSIADSVWFKSLYSYLVCDSDNAASISFKYFFTLDKIALCFCKSLLIMLIIVILICEYCLNISLSCLVTFLFFLFVSWFCLKSCKEV